MMSSNDVESLVSYDSEFIQMSNTVSWGLLHFCVNKEMVIMIASKLRLHCILAAASYSMTFFCVWNENLPLRLLGGRFAGRSNNSLTGKN